MSISQPQCDPVASHMHILNATVEIDRVIVSLSALKSRLVEPCKDREAFTPVDVCWVSVHDFMGAWPPLAMHRLGDIWSLMDEIHTILLGYQLQSDPLDRTRCNTETDTLGAINHVFKQMALLEQLLSEIVTDLIEGSGKGLPFECPQMEVESLAAAMAAGANRVHGWVQRMITLIQHMEVSIFTRSPDAAISVAVVADPKGDTTLVCGKDARR